MCDVKVSHKKCGGRVSHKSVKVSGKGVKHECPTKMSSKGVVQECQGNVSSKCHAKSVKLQYLTRAYQERVSSESVK